VADQAPCPVCGLGGGFHNSDTHSFGIERAKELWGSPLRPDIERKDYTPYAFRAGDNEYVIIWKKDGGR